MAVADGIRLRPRNRPADAPCAAPRPCETMRFDRFVSHPGEEFLFVLGAPRIQGTVQMVINPVAIR